MVATAFGPEAPAQPGTAAAPALFLAGMGSFAAMILPGLSGGYILVLSGQYVPILTAVDGVKSAVLQVGRSPWHLLVESAWILAPFALGGMLALVGMSWLVDWLLGKQRSLMLGFLLGLLIGAVLGLWPFEAAGTGPAMPDLVHATAALGLVACGFALTAAVARLGSLDRGP